MRRAAISVPANIAEGFKRRGLKDKSYFYNIAQGSLEELRYFIILCRDLGHNIDYDDLASRASQIARMLAGASVTEEARAAAKRLLAGNG